MAHLWAESQDVPFRVQTWKVVCNQHFSDAEITFPECLRLNRIEVPSFCATSSHSDSAPKLTEHTFPTPPMNYSAHLFSCPDYLPAQKPIKTYLHLSITASKHF